jgi:hypothetical protein
VNRGALAAYIDAERRRRRARADPSGAYGYAVLQQLENDANGFVFDPINDLVLVKRNGFPTFLGDMAQALAAGIMVYTSPSTKYVRNSAGVLVPGTTLRCHYSASASPLGLLSEPMRQNHLINSEVSSGTTGVTVSSNVGTAPDGALTAELITEDTSSGEHYAGDGSYAVTSGLTYTFSGFVKKGPVGSRRLQVRTAIAKNASFVFDTATGAYVSGSGYDSYGITALPSGWFYFWMVVTATSTTSLVCRVQGATTNAIYTGDGASNWYYWGRKLETGAFPTSYTKTEASAVTRNADNLYVDLTKVPFSATAGSIIAIGQPPQDTLTGGARFWQIDDGTNDSAIYTKAGTAGSKQRSASIVAATAEQLTVTPTTNDSAARFAEALAWGANNAQLVVNGATRGAAGTSVTLPTGLTALRIGGDASRSDGSYAAAPLESLVYLPERLSQTEMIARTTL